MACLRERRWPLTGLLVTLLLGVCGPAAADTWPDGTMRGPAGPAPAAPAAMTLVRVLPAIGFDPRGVEVSGGRAWTTDAGHGLIHQIDPATGSAVFTFPSPSSFGADLASDGTSLWNTDPGTDRIYRFDPSTGATLGSFPTPGGITDGIAWDGANLWCSDAGDSRMYKLDPATGQTLSSFPIPAFGLPYGVAWDGSFLYLAYALAGQILRFDRTTGALLDTYTTPTFNPTGLAFDGVHFWYVDYVELKIYVVDLPHPTPTVATTWGRLKSQFR